MAVSGLSHPDRPPQRSSDWPLDLVQWVREEFGISLSEATTSRELKALGFSKVSARPRDHARNELAIDDFKKDFPAELTKVQGQTSQENLST